MDALDTSDIDLDPANFRCRADLWYCLDRLYTKIGRPSYEDFHDEIRENMGISLPTSTMSNLIGESSKTSTGRVSWNTVKRFVLGCGVPEMELERWRKAWEASEAQDRPAWPEERKQLLAKIDQLTADFTEAGARADRLTADLAEEKARIDHFTSVSAAAKRRTDQLTNALAAATAHTDQLTTDLAEAKIRADQLTAELAAKEKRASRSVTAFAEVVKRVNQTRIDELTAAVEAAEARATDAEAALAAYHQSQSIVFCLPGPLEQLRVKAETFYDAGDCVGAVGLYKQIAAQVEREYGLGDPLTLQARCRYLEIETRVFQNTCQGNRSNVLFRDLKRRRLDARWRHLISEHQRHLPERDRSILELRLKYVHWVARLLNPVNPNNLRNSPSPARKLLIALHADCKLFLSPGDPFATLVAEEINTPDVNFNHSERVWSPTKLREPQRRPQRPIVSRVAGSGIGSASAAHDDGADDPRG